MNKVVINNCYGGFSLSKEAMLRLFELGYKDEYYNEENLDSEDNLFGNYYPYIQRHDPRLIQVVEELEEYASGSCARLQVVSINSDLYLINEYDGLESIETPYDAKPWINIMSNEE